MTKRYGHLIEQWNAAKDEMREILIRCAREKRTITYGEVSAEIQAASIHPYSYAMAHMLDEVSEENVAQGKTALATLVVRKSDGRPAKTLSSSGRNSSRGCARNGKIVRRR